MEHLFWCLRLQFVLLVLSQVVVMRGETVLTTPTAKRNDSRDSRTYTEDSQSQISNNSVTSRPTLRPYQDYPGATGVGSWQEISMNPTKDTRNGRTLADTNAQGLSSTSSSNYSSSCSAIHLATGLIYLTLTWRL